MITKKQRRARIILTAIATILAELLVILYKNYFTDDDVSNETFTNMWVFMGGILIVCAFVIVDILKTAIKEPPIERKPRS
ncbi:MAG: hypothetical protein KBB86_02800 [Candidatus Pacebacteria bacterium]|nr:hypothetical protein [Candidatus Paceibacterota bacterium]